MTLEEKNKCEISYTLESYTGTAGINQNQIMKFKNQYHWEEARDGFNTINDVQHSGCRNVTLNFNEMKNHGLSKCYQSLSSIPRNISP